MINLDLLRDVELSRADDLCRHFFPHGRKVGNEWRMGDITGAPGDSLGVQLVGEKAGLWHDRATGQGGDLVKLIRENRNITFLEAVEQIERAIGVNLCSTDDQTGTDSNCNVSTYPQPT